MGTLIAWVLVRDDFPGKSVVNALIDLPFALPTIVAGLTLLTLYGPRSPFGINIAFSQAGILVALLFVTLPFVVRSVQPVLLELDTDMEEAAASLGADPPTIVRRIVMPNLLPAILTGSALGFARAIGEFGAVVLISGNIPFKTEVASVNILTQLEGDDPQGAAAVSVVLMVGSLVMLTTLDYVRRRTDPPRAGLMTARRDADVGAARRIRSVSSARSARGHEVRRPLRGAGLPAAAARAAGDDGLLQDLRARSRAGAQGHLAGPGFQHAFWLTLTITAIVVPINTVFGVITALVMVRREFRGKALLNALIDLPFALSPIIIGLSLILVWGKYGWFGPALESIGFQVIFAMPGMVARDHLRVPAVRGPRGHARCCARSAPTRRRPPTPWARRDWRAFWRVTLPSIRWGVAYGIILTTARSLGEFGAVTIVSGKLTGKTETLTLHVEERIDSFDFVGAYTASLVLALMAISGAARDAAVRVRQVPEERSRWPSGLRAWSSASAPSWRSTASRSTSPTAS